MALKRGNRQAKDPKILANGPSEQAKTQNNNVVLSQNLPRNGANPRCKRRMIIPAHPSVPLVSNCLAPQSPTSFAQGAHPVVGSNRYSPGSISDHRPKTRCLGLKYTTHHGDPLINKNNTNKKNKNIQSHGSRFRF